MSTSKPILPQLLKAGDSVAVVASGSPFEPKDFAAGVAWLKSLGLVVRIADDIFACERYLAGSDERRFRELKDALLDKNCRAIFLARGGYGSARLVSLLDTIKKKPQPKWIVGYSDGTSLQLYAKARWGWGSCYGAHLDGMSLDQYPQTAKDLARFLFTGKTPAIRGSKMIRPGKARGELIGGCLSIVVTTLGTSYEINTDNKILFLEDVGEKAYRIDRMLTHLRLAGKFKKCRGVIWGTTGAPDLASEKRDYIPLIQEFFTRDKFPVIVGMPFGHRPDKRALPIGREVMLDGARKTLEIL